MFSDKPRPGLANPTNHKIEMTTEPVQLDSTSLTAAMVPRLQVSKVFDIDTPKADHVSSGLEPPMTGEEEIGSLVDAIRSASVDISTESESLISKWSTFSDSLSSEKDRLPQESPEVEVESSVSSSDSIETEAETPEKGQVAFRPMLQVDSFVWPKLCTHMSPVARERLSELAERLVEKDSTPLFTSESHVEAARGKVVGLAGSSSKAGTTTLLLTLARCLAEQGQRVVLMDANLAKPQLADQLGLEPEFGWESVAQGQQPMAEVLIESIEDRMTLLPLCNDSIAGSLGLLTAPTLDIRVSMEVVRRHYDLVLVDIGVPDLEGEAALSLISEFLDTAIIVHNVRDSSRRHLIESRDRLREFGMRVSGIVENFAAIEAASTLRPQVA